VFHAANVLLHAGTALVVLEILRRVAGAQSRGNAPARSVAFGAWVGAMVFALHPVQVEAVAWVAGLKDVAAGLFSLVAIWLYFSEEGHEGRPPAARDPSARRHEGKIRFVLATVSLILAMLAKPIAMMTPFIALVIDWMLRRRFRWQLLIWFALAIGCAVIAKWSQPAPFAGIVVPLWQRPFVAGDALAFYLFKILWPVRLGVDYGRTPVERLGSHWPYLTSLVPVALAIVLWIKRRTWRPVLAGAIVFVLGLLPILGLVPFDFQIYSTVADHYLYLPMLGIAIIIAFAVSRWSQVNGAHPTIGVVILVVVLGFCTFLQAMTWKDSLSLFNHALEVNPRSWMAHVNLASALNRSQRPQDAEAEARAALAIRSDIAVTYDNLAAALRLQGKTQEAIDAYRRATALDPKDSLAWTGLGHLLSNQGDLTGAIDVYLHAVDTNPYDPDARINLASALAEQGQLERAIELYQSALKLKPNSPEAMAGLKKAKEEISHRSGTDEHR
jgi:Flp pilus assembly protein TadD